MFVFTVGTRLVRGVIPTCHHCSKGSWVQISSKDTHSVCDNFPQGLLDNRVSRPLPLPSQCEVTCRLKHFPNKAVNQSRGLSVFVHCHELQKIWWRTYPGLFCAPSSGSSNWRPLRSLIFLNHFFWLPRRPIPGGLSWQCVISSDIPEPNQSPFDGDEHRFLGTDQDNDETANEFSDFCSL